ncbi:MAG: 8-oxoguanine DNA glycosylase [Dehalococcoidia bacterium]|nr:8-oxoguanine DNA glycosylase [Dehalococcoidia bacterium]
MQTIYASSSNGIIELELPEPEDEILSGVPWGRFDIFFTPAFWACQVWLNEAENMYKGYHLGENLMEEVAACLLGGHGIPAEVGIAAFRRLKERKLLDQYPSAQEIEAALSEPLVVNGRSVRYRFARQKARYLAEALHRLSVETPPTSSGKAFRAFLLDLPGIGPKTASWITRNWLDSDEVAILDIHIVRAAIAAGVFPTRVNLAQSYFILEDRFLKFAKALRCRPAVLDNFIWHQMRRIGRLPCIQTC